LTIINTNHWPQALVLFLLVLGNCSEPGTNQTEANAVLLPAYETDWGPLQGNPEVGLLLAKRTCSTCHIVDGMGKALSTAPPFTQTAARPDMQADYLRRWLKNPLAIKPGTQMPILGLSDRDIEHYIAYLHSLKPVSH